MAIDYVLLTDTFGHWVVTTNEIIDALNREVLDDLLTTDKSSLVGAINELFNNKYDKTGGPITGNVDISGNLNTQGHISVGKNTGGNSYIQFFDDADNVYRELLWDASSQTWKIRDKNNVLQNLLHSGLNINLGTLANLVGDTQLLFKGGTAAENDAYTGALRELTIDMENGSIRLHDGVTPGGIVISGGGGLEALDTFLLGTHFTTGATVINLSVEPSHKNNTTVMMNGLYQNKSTYNISGTTLTFTSPILAGVTVIEVQILG